MGLSRTCEHCGGSMEARSLARARFCSAECKEAARNEALRQATLKKREGRVCRQCGAVIPVAMSSKAQCCSLACSIQWANAAKAARKRASNLAKRGPCRGCGAEIPADLRSHAIYCSRDCMRQDVRARNYDSDRARELNRQYLYGMTTEEFEKLLETQGGTCAICGTTDWPGKANRPHVDHCHATGTVRGILCTNCNLGLGRFKDRVDLLEAAIAYLSRIP